MCAARLNGIQKAVEEEGRGAGGAGLGREGGAARENDAARENVGGRPRVLDATRRAEVCALLAAGCSLRTAANYVGCDVSTISKMKGRDAAFRDQVVKALAEREAFPLSKLREACGRSWRAAAWLLERTVGGHFRRESTENPLDWEREIIEETTSRSPEVAGREME